METRVRITNPFGSTFQTVPNFLSAQVVWPFRDKSTLNLHYPEMGVNSALLNGECEAVFEYHNGSEWVEPLDSRFRTSGRDRDRLEQTPTSRFDFIALMPSMLESAFVWEPAGLDTDVDGNILFSAASPGRILRTLFFNARDRGWGADLTLDFTDTHDSNGQLWGTEINLSLQSSQTLYEILSALGNQGVVDWAGQGRTLRVFKPDTFLGRDRTNVRLLAAHGETSAPEQISYRDRATVLRVVGDGGQVWDRANGVSPWGRLEALMSAGGVADEGTAYLLSDEELLKSSGARVSRTREFNIASKFLPQRDYRTGDHVTYQTGTTTESMRVFSMSLTIEQNLTGYSVLGDRFEDALISAARKQNALVIGRVNGGNGQQPTQPSDDVRDPTKPLGFLATSSVYLDPDGQEIGRISMGWNHTGKATDGTAIDLDRFEFRIRESFNKESKWQSFRSVDGAERSVTVSPVRVRRDDQSAEVYDLAIRAVSTATRVSSWVYFNKLLMETDTTPPPVPSAPIGETVYGTITARWDGLGAAGEIMPPDFHHTEAEIGTTPEGPWTFFATFEREGAQVVPFHLDYGTYWLRLRSVDRIGNKSEWSALGEVTSRPLVELPDIHDMIDEIDTRIEGVMNSANGANRIIHSTKDPSVDGKEQEGDTWFRWTDGAHITAPKLLLGQWTWNAGKWTRVEMSHEVLASIDLGKATVGMLDGIFIKTDTLHVGQQIVIADMNNLATIDPSRDLNVTTPATWATETRDGLTYKKPGGGDYLMFMNRSGPVPVESEDWVRISYTYVATNSGSAQLRMWLYKEPDGSGGNVSSDPKTVAFEPGLHTVTYDVQVPDTDVFGSVGSWVVGLMGADARTIGVKDVRVYKKMGATLISPDSIDTPMLRAGIIKTEHLQSNIVETDNLAFGFADGQVITGALFQTIAAPNLGIKLDGHANRLSAWSPDGIRVFALNANNGDLVLGAGEAIRLYGSTGNINIGNGKMLFDAGSGNLTIQGEFATSTTGRRARLSDTNLTAALNVYADSSNARGSIYAVKPSSTNMVQTAYRYHTDASTGTDYEFQYAMTENTWRIGTMTTEHFIGHGPTGAATVNTYVESPVILNRPYTLTANVVITANGILGIASSASRYKLAQRTMKLSDDLLNIPVKDWYDKTESEESDQLGELGVRTKSQQRMFENRTRTPGVVAEDVAEVTGGESFVIRDSDGQTQGVAYDRLALAQISVLKRKNDALEARLARLEKQLNKGA